MKAQLAAAWRVCHGITLAFLDEIPEAALTARYSPKTRTVASQFAHIHYVRVRNLETRGKPFLGDLESFPRGAEPAKRELAKALKGSGAALTKLLDECEEKGAVKSWSGPPSTYLGYLVAHETYHRALAVVAMRLSGHKLTPSLTQELWYDWRRGA